MGDLENKRPFPLLDSLRIRKLKPGRNFYIFLVCLSISTLFWLLNAFSKSYTQVIHFPVKYEELPEDQVLLNSPPTEIGVEVEGVGFDLIDVRDNYQQDTLRVNGNEIKLRQVGVRQEATYATRTLRGQVNRYLASNLEVKDFELDSLFFVWEKKATRLVPLNLDLDLNMAKQYVLNGEVELIPTAVQLSGPQSILDTIQAIKTARITLTDINESQELYTELIIPGLDDGVKAQPSKAIVKIPVDEYTEDTLAVPVLVKNLPDSLRIRTFPDEVVITFRVALSRHKDIKPALFECAIDFEDLDYNSSGKLKVRTITQPNFAEIVRVRPERVEYILRK